MYREAQLFPNTVQQVKRWLKIVAGFTLLGAGIVMLVTPGPGWLVIAMGLALLAAEFLWARRLLQGLKAKGALLRQAIRPSSGSSNVQRPGTPATKSGSDPTPAV